MGIYTRRIYKEFAHKIDESKKENASMILLTVPGMGASHFVRKYMEEAGGKMTRIVGEGESLEGLNFLDLDFDKRGIKESLELIDGYMKQTDLRQKFVVVMNMPYVLSKKEYRDSYLASHVYSSWLMRVNDKGETEDFVEELGIELSVKEQTRVFELSGGIGRLIKYLAVNKEKLSWQIDKLVADSELMRVFDKSLEVIGKTSDEVLVKMGIKDSDDGFVSDLVKDMLNKRMVEKGVDIKIERDLSFFEFGAKQDERLTNMEAVLLKALVVSKDLLLTRDEIADLKWGDESYEGYSDQAIGKAMGRLEKKLKKHKLVAIPKVGYKLELN